MKLNLNKEQTERIVFLAIAVVIAVIVLLTFIFVPGFRKIGFLRNKINEEKTKLLDAEKDIANFAKIKKDFNDLEKKIKQYQLNMPQPTPDWLLEKLNYLGNETGISFDKMEHKGYISQTGKYRLQGLYLELKTDYHSLGKFINKLENSSSFLKIMDLSIIGNKDDVKKHIVKITVGAYVNEQK